MNWNEVTQIKIDNDKNLFLFYNKSKSILDTYKIKLDEEDYPYDCDITLISSNTKEEILIWFDYDLSAIEGLPFIRIGNPYLQKIVLAKQVIKSIQIPNKDSFIYLLGEPK